MIWKLAICDALRLALSFLRVGLFCLSQPFKKYSSIEYEEKPIKNKTQISIEAFSKRTTLSVTQHSYLIDVLFKNIHI